MMCSVGVGGEKLEYDWKYVLHEKISFRIVLLVTAFRMNLFIKAIFQDLLEIKMMAKTISNYFVYRPYKYKFLFCYFRSCAWI